MRAGGPAGRGTPARLSWLLAGLVAAWTLVAFLPTVWNGFVSWDDPRMLLENPNHRGSYTAELRYAWSNHLLGHFAPMTWMTYTLDRRIWGLHAPGYHLTSLVLHILAALAVYSLARLLLRLALGPDPPGFGAIDVGAAVTALIFAVHPLRVEPVAWVSARSTVLGGLLLVLSTLAYVVGWTRRGRVEGVPPAWLALSLVLFLASLLARETGLVLPAVLVILDAYPLRRLSLPPTQWASPAVRRVWVEKAPFALIALVAIPIGFLARGVEVGDFGHTDWDPLMSVSWALYSTGFYVWQSVGVATLSPIYPMPTRELPMLLATLRSALAIIAITLGLVAGRRRWPGPLAAWVAYLVVTAPMSGILPFGRLRGVVDRYTYVACIGWALVIGGAVASSWRARLAGRVSRLRVWAIVGSIVVGLLGWSLASWRQAAVWRDGVALWTRAVMVVPSSPVARSNLGTALAARGDFAGALVQYREAVREMPTHPGPYQNLGRALAAERRYREAEEPLRRVAELRPNWAEAHLDLGTVLYDLGRLDDAVVAFTRAVELAPDFARAHEYLGAALWRLGREGEAASHFKQAAALGSAGRPDPHLVVPQPGAAGPDGS